MLKRIFVSDMDLWASLKDIIRKLENDIKGKRG